RRRLQRAVQYRLRICNARSRVGKRTRRSGGLLRSQSGPLPTPGAASRRNATVSAAATIVLTSVINAASGLSVGVEEESRRAHDVELVEREMEAISYSHRADA